MAAAVQERCLVEFEDCDGLGSILGSSREEYAAEAASFVVLRALEAYARLEEMAGALMAVPSFARQQLDWGHALMLRHREELRELAEEMSRELMECGEECMGF